jgi:small subunit ribosomal protein S20
MANSKSALKRVRQIKRRTDRNKVLRTQVKSLRKKSVEAAQAGKTDEAQAALKELSSAVDRAQKKGVFHRNKAANLKSRAAKALKTSAAS